MNLSRLNHRPLLRLRATCSKALFAGLVLLSSTLVRADLPTMEAPSRGEGAGLIDTIKNYAYDGGILLGLLIAWLFTTPTTARFAGGHAEGCSRDPPRPLPPASVHRRQHKTTSRGRQHVS